MIGLKTLSINKTDDGVEYILSLKCAQKKGQTSRDAVLLGIKRVFGYDEEELLSGGADVMHTYARKVYSRLRKGMGITVPDIARELHKAPASVVHYLKDESAKVEEYCEAVTNG